MKTCISSTAAVAVLLSVVSGPVFGAGTSLVYTFGGPFNLRIPANPAATKGWMQGATIVVPDHLIISDLDVCVKITHTSAIDLQLYLWSPAGTPVILNTGNSYGEFYRGGDYDSTTFDDEADTPIEDGLPPFSGSYRPVNPLTAFDGRDAYGTWTLKVYDAFYADTGYLESFTLAITVPAPAEAIVVPAPAAGGLALLGLVLIRRRKRKCG